MLRICEDDRPEQHHEREQENTMKTIAFFNTKGGVGSTMLAGCSTIFATEACIDVHAGTASLDVIRPDLWVVPMDSHMAYEHAVRSAPMRHGPELWVWNNVPGRWCRFS